MNNRLYTSFDGRQSHRHAEEWEGSRRIARSNGGSLSGSRDDLLTDVLRTVQHEWPQLQTEDCNPITTALELLDKSSVGKATKYDDFEELRIRLQRTLQNIVNDHFEGFTSSIATFNGMSNAIQVSQMKVKRLREQLMNAKASFSSPQPLNLTELSASSKSYDETLQQLEQIQSLQKVPDLLESQISQKQFLKSVDTLQTAMQTITSKQMMQIAALTDLRGYLRTQVATLADILVEELHNHLYLKSPYCDSRWQAYTIGQEQMPDNRQQPLNQQSSPPNHSLETFLNDLESGGVITQDPDDNPEIDSFAYIRLLLESLSGLNKLPECMNTLNQRMPIELYRLVDKTINEIEQRHSSVLRAPQQKSKTSLPNPLRSNEYDSAALILRDFLWTLYSKFDALLQGHRAIHDVQLHIAKVKGKKDALTYSFLDVWKPIQSEVRSLMRDYLNEDSKLEAAEHSTLSSLNNLFAKKKRDRSKALFKLEDVDSQSTDYTQNRRDLETILQNSVPGLISNPDRYRQVTRNKANSAAGHTILVEPYAYNMIVILKPTFAFVERAAQIAPKSPTFNLSSFTSFIDDFLMNVLHPQLEDAVSELFNDMVHELGAFEEEAAWNSLSLFPIQGIATRFFTLMHGLCDLLNMMPSHCDDFSQLLTSVLAKCYQQYLHFYQELKQKQAKDDADAEMDSSMRLPQRLVDECNRRCRMD